MNSGERPGSGEPNQAGEDGRQGDAERLTRQKALRIGNLSTRMLGSSLLVGWTPDPVAAGGGACCADGRAPRESERRPLSLTCFCCLPLSLTLLCLLMLWFICACHFYSLCVLLTSLFDFQVSPEARPRNTGRQTSRDAVARLSPDDSQMTPPGTVASGRGERVRASFIHAKDSDS